MDCLKLAVIVLLELKITKSRCITAARLFHLKFILCHFNELHFHSGIRCQFLYPDQLPVQK